MAKAYISSNNERSLLLEDIASLKVEDGQLLVTTLFGEQREVKAAIREIDFMASNIVLENSGD